MMTLSVIRLQFYAAKESHVPYRDPRHALQEH